VPITTKVVSSESCLWRDEPVLDTALCDKVCHWFATVRWLSPGTLVSSTNKTDRHDINEILFKGVTLTDAGYPLSTATLMYTSLDEVL
jgi:hypothetical protein